MTYPQRKRRWCGIDDVKGRPSLTAIRQLAAEPVADSVCGLTVGACLQPVTRRMEVRVSETTGTERIGEPDARDVVEQDREEKTGRSKSASSTSRASSSTAIPSQSIAISRPTPAGFHTALPTASPHCRVMIPTASVTTSGSARRRFRSRGAGHPAAWPRVMFMSCQGRPASGSRSREGRCPRSSSQPPPSPSSL